MTDSDALTLDDGELIDCCCSGIELPQSQLRDVTFTDCKLDDANLRMARLVHVRFDASVLVGALLGTARLDGVAFPGCDLGGAGFSRVRAHEVDLRDARLSGLQGVDSRRGATIGPDRLVELAPALAYALGLVVRGDD